MEPYQENFETVINFLKTDSKQGLSPKVVAERQIKFGKNLIAEEKGIPYLSILIRQFLSPLMLVLLISAILSVSIGHAQDAIVIFIAVLLNVLFGFFQELKAEKSAKALKKFEVPHCKVIRDGEEVLIEAKNLVPGDIVPIFAGDKVPADLRLIKALNLTTDEAILTGESRPVEKNIYKISNEASIGDRKNMLFSGTLALSGRGKGIVVATGKKSYMGKIAKLVEETKDPLTPLQKQMKKFSWWLGGIFLLTVSAVFILGLVKNISFYEILITSIALGVAAIPEGLLVAVTVVLAIGMQKMLKRKALVRNLLAAETLGCVSVICTDKTGTLTQGQMTVSKIITPDLDLELTKSENESEKSITKEKLRKMIVALTLNNNVQSKDNSKNIIGQPTEISILKFVKNYGADTDKIRKEHIRIDEIPFSSKTKYMLTLNQFEGYQKIIVKGAPEKIIGMCSLSEESSNSFNKKANLMAKSGLRVLAIAEKKVHEKNIERNNSSQLKNLEFLGLIGINDPLRPQSKDTIKELKKAGIRVVIVTGDHKDTAESISKSAGITPNGKTILGTELDKTTQEELENKIENINIFARVDPSHKIRIVRAWQKMGYSVAMTGDGVNDAPALKAADIGVALGSGSDVAHEISDMVLLDNNLSSIDAAVKEGRTIFDNIRKIIVYLMTDSFSEIILISGALIFNLPLPIMATQIFWINLVTDGLPYLSLAFEPPEKNIMNRPPREKNDPVVNRKMKVLIFLIGIITDIGLFALYFLLLKSNMHLKHIRTVMFTALSIDSLFYIFSVRTMHQSIFKSHPFSNVWLLPSVIFGFATQLLVIYFPPMQKLFHTIYLNFFDWIIIIFLSLVKIISIEITKIFLFKNKE